MDSDLLCYLVGSYVYNIYNTYNTHNTHNTHTDINDNFKITGDKDHYYYVLGWHIEQSYPEAYKHLTNVFNNILLLDIYF